MTNTDWANVLTTMTGLWPKQATKLTYEEANVWRTLFDPHPCQRCQQVLRDLAMTTKFFPRPCEAREKLQALRTRHGGQARRETPPPTEGDLARQNLVPGFPGRQAEFDAMGDHEAIHALQQNIYENYVEVYGHESSGTVGRYWRWQRAAYTIGLRDAEPEYREGWSEASRAAYEAETGHCGVQGKEIGTSDCQVTSVGYNDSDESPENGERTDPPGGGNERDDADGDS